MVKALDLVGERFGRLLVIERAENTADGRSRWLCRCDCGTEKVVHASPLRAGTTSSCGCFMREHQARAGERAWKHGQRDRREYAVWQHMRKRCSSPGERNYKNYGGRGIKVCERWESFAVFLADMGPAPSPAHSLDRIDVNGDYAPDNCRWATASEQANNRRNNRRIVYQGQEKTATEWARIVGIDANTIIRGILYGWPVERAMTTPPRRTGAGA